MPHAYATGPPLASVQSTIGRVGTLPVRQRAGFGKRVGDRVHFHGTRGARFYVSGNVVADGDHGTRGLDRPGDGLVQGWGGQHPTAAVQLQRKVPLHHVAQRLPRAEDGFPLVGAIHVFDLIVGKVRIQRQTSAREYGPLQAPYGRVGLARCGRFDALLVFEHAQFQPLRARYAKSARRTSTDLGMLGGQMDDAIAPVLLARRGGLGGFFEPLVFHESGDLAHFVDYC